MPPVLGYTGVHGHLTAAALAVFAVLFVWQIPHFLAITLFRHDDYRNAGLQVMSVSHGVEATRRAVVISAFVLWATTLLPTWAGLGGQTYLVGAMLSGAAFCGWTVFGQRGRSLEGWARSVFFASLPYVVVLFALLAWSAA
jgi:protoheme IX farnesyltransferase